MFHKIKIQLDKIGGFISTRLDFIDKENFVHKIKLLNISIYLPEMQSVSEILPEPSSGTTFAEKCLIQVLKIFLNLLRFFLNLKH